MVLNLAVVQLVALANVAAGECAASHISREQTTLNVQSLVVEGNRAAALARHTSSARCTAFVPVASPAPGQACRVASASFGTMRHQRNGDCKHRDDELDGDVAHELPPRAFEPLTSLNILG